jgi:transposase
MGLKRTDEFRMDAVRIALTSGLTRKQVAADLGVGMLTCAPSIPPAFWRVLGFDLMALCGQFVHAHFLCKFHRCQSSER